MSSKKTPALKTPAKRGGKGASASYTAFEGANHSTLRAFFTSAPLGSREEVDTFARTELNRRAQLLFNKSPHLVYLARQLANLIVGPGIFPIAQTSDTAWNERAEDFFDNWSSTPFLCDAKRQLTFWQRQRLVIKDEFRQGESFVAKVSTGTAWPQFQTINPARVVSVGKVPSGFELWDGIILGSSGEKVGIRVQEDKNKVTDLTLENFCHVIDVERTDQYRAPTILYSGTNSTQDLCEAMAAGKARHKLQSMLAMAVTRQAGKATGKTSVSGNLRSAAAAAAGAETELERQAKKLIEEFRGFGAIAYLNPGEEIKLLQPGGEQALKEFATLLIAELAQSAGVPPELFFQLSDLGSAGVRVALELLASVILVWRDRINEQLNDPFWVFVIASAMKRGELPRCKDPMWWKVAWQGPPSATIDLGRMGALQINLVNNGMGTLAEFWSAKGKDWRKALRQQVLEIRYAQELCQENSDDKIVVDYERHLRPAILRGVGTPAAETPATEETEDQPKKKKTE
jgi:capsid protein